jgi:hypothetical protein
LLGRADKLGQAPPWRRPGQHLGAGIFNIVSDAVIRHRLTLVIDDNGEVAENGFAPMLRNACFLR